MAAATPFHAEVTSKNITFDVPPPGLGFTSVTDAVLATAMFEAGTLAVNSERLTKVVASELWFQSTTAPRRRAQWRREPGAG